MTADKTSQMQKMSAARWIYVNGKHSSEPFLSFPIQKCLDKYIKKFDYSVICRETLWWCDYDKLSWAYYPDSGHWISMLKTMRFCNFRYSLDIGSLSNNDATASKTSLKSEVALLQTLSRFLILSHSIRQILAAFAGVEF